MVDQQIISLRTAHVVARGGSHKKRNWGWIGGGTGGGTGGGALIGALAAGGKGALIGSGIGAAAGTTTAFITGKKDVVFGNERRLRFRLNQDVSVFG
jgi:predicted lipid-binding transport protein (Tim44 family)